MGKIFVRGKENYSLAEKKEPGELVEKYKKEDDKEVKAICNFSMQKVSTRQTKRKGTLLTLFRPLQMFQPPPPTYYILHKFPTSLLVRTPSLFGTLE